MEEDSDENQEKHQAPENLHEILMARAFYEELKLAEIKIAFDAQNAEQVVKLTGELLYEGPGTKAN